MLKHLFLSALMGSLAMTTANAQEPRDFSQAATQTVQLPGTDHTIVFSSPELQAGEPRDMQAVSVAIASWLTASFGFHAIRELPRVEYTSRRQIAAVRYRNLMPNKEADLAGVAASTTWREAAPSVYDDALKIIYLPEGWNGSTPAELSVFVREMVHHLQNEAGLKYDCPEARDGPAYLAQDRWLTMSGSDAGLMGRSSTQVRMLHTQCTP